MDNIILIGMPGVGKSTIGVILAKILGYHFVDTDLIIQEQQAQLLKDIISEKGVDGFIEIENKVNKELNLSKTVIATGGSVVYGSEAMEHLRTIGTVVYIRLDLNTLSNRLDNMMGRGVVLKDGQNLTSLYEERTPLYEKYAHIIIDEEGKSIEQTIQVLVDKLDKYRLL